MFAATRITPLYRPSPFIVHHSSLLSMDSYAFSATLELSNNKLWGAHFVVPDAIAQVFVSEGAKRVVCTLNGRETHQCALLPKGDGSYLITVNKKLRDTLRLRESSRLQVALQKDESEFGLPVPEEFSASLEADPAGADWFYALTPGKQRTLLYIAQSVKNSDLRIARSIAILEHLKQNGGKIDYRQLNEAIKTGSLR